MTQSPAPPAPLEVEACAVSFKGETIKQARWGGRIAVYDASVDAKGIVTAVARRDGDTPEPLAQWFRLDQMDDCLRRWRFADSGSYVIVLMGGNVMGSVWVIDVSRKGQSSHFRLRMPFPDP